MFSDSAGLVHVMVDVINYNALTERMIIYRANQKIMPEDTISCSIPIFGHSQTDLKRMLDYLPY